MRRFLVLAMVLVFVAACSGGESTDTTGATSDDGGSNSTVAGDDSEFEVIEVTDISYPASVTIPAGKGVKFYNTSGVDHTVTFDTMDDEPFDLDFALGDTAEIGFPLVPGRYTYHCSIHASMVGELVVEG